MRVSYTNVVSGARESIYLSLEQLENKKRVEEIENEIEELYRQFNPELERERDFSFHHNKKPPLLTSRDFFRMNPARAGYGIIS